jgi:hypothetical protein
MAREGTVDCSEVVSKERIDVSEMAREEGIEASRTEGEETVGVTAGVASCSSSRSSSIPASSVRESRGKGD